MPRKGSLSKPNQKMSQEEYIKWYHEVIKTNALGTFAKFGIELPAEFEEIPPHEQDLYNERVEELIYRLAKEHRSENEEFIEKEAQFVGEDDWKALHTGKLKNVGITFKVFQGKNYLMEFVNRGHDIEFHVMLTHRTMGPQLDVFDSLVLLMDRIVPAYWRVVLSFVDPVTPCHEQERGEDMKAVSSYCIKFVGAAKNPGATHILNQCLKNILANFLLPVHHL